MAWTFAGFLLPWIVSRWSPAASISIAALLAIFAVLGVMGRLRIKQIGAWRTIGVIWLAVAFATVGTNSFAQTQRLAELERASPTEYLAEIKRAGDDDRWLTELRRLDPKGFAAETQRRDTEHQLAIAREQELAAASTARMSQGNGEWFSGGTLGHATVPRWRAAGAADRLATAADMAALMLGEQRAVALGSMEALKPFAFDLMTCVDEAVAGGAADTLNVTDVAASCALLLGFGE